MPSVEVHTNWLTGERQIIVRLEPLALPSGAPVPTQADLAELSQLVMGWGNQWATPVAKGEAIDVTYVEVEVEEIRQLPESC